MIREGDALEAIRASISIPGVLTPVARQGGYLVDGGLVNPIPVSVARQLGASFVVAVKVLPLAEEFYRHASVPRIGMFEFQRSRELIEAGRAAAEQRLPALRAALARAAPVRDRLRRWLATAPLRAQE